MTVCEDSVCWPFVMILCDHIWWPCGMIVCDDLLWWSCVMPLCADSLWRSCVNMWWHCIMILCDDPVWWLWVIQLCDGRVWWPCVTTSFADPVWWLCVMAVCGGPVWLSHDVQAKKRAARTESTRQGRFVTWCSGYDKGVWDRTGTSCWMTTGYFGTSRSCPARWLLCSCWFFCSGWLFVLVTDLCCNSLFFLELFVLICSWSNISNTVIYGNLNFWLLFLIFVQLVVDFFSFEKIPKEKI